MPPTMSDDATGSTTIDIRRTDVENLVSRFDVRLRDGDGSATEHVVTVSRPSYHTSMGSVHATASPSAVVAVTTMGA